MITIYCMDTDYQNERKEIHNLIKELTQYSTELRITQYDDINSRGLSDEQKEIVKDSYLTICTSTTVELKKKTQKLKLKLQQK
jgi:hypothetical protein